MTRTEDSELGVVGVGWWVVGGGWGWGWGMEGGGGVGGGRVNDEGETSQPTMSRDSRL